MKTILVIFAMALSFNSFAEDTAPPAAEPAAAMPAETAPAASMPAEMGGKMDRKRARMECKKEGKKGKNLKSCVETKVKG